MDHKLRIRNAFNLNQTCQTFQLQPALKGEDFFHSPQCYRGSKEKKKKKNYRPYITIECNVICCGKKKG